MVRPEHQRQGLGRLLTEKCNQVADAAGAATYATARLGAAALFVQMGFEVLETIDVDLSELEAGGGVEVRFVMKRESGAEDWPGRRLV